MENTNWGTFKAELTEEIEKARQELLLAESFDEMEDIALATGNILHEKLLRAAIEDREQRKTRKCPECGGKLKAKGKKERRLKTSRGEVKIKRDRYACEDCGSSIFPPG